MILLNSTPFYVIYIASAYAASTFELTFTYHYYSELYHSENQSIFSYDGADAREPLKSSAFQSTFKCENEGVQSGFTVWSGAVAWSTQPLAVDAHVSGDVILRTWMSSTDEDVGLGSGYGMTITEIDEEGTVIWDQLDYQQSMFGKAISNTPTEYTITLSVNHTFQKGHIIVFGVGAGCTKRGWTVNVFFDSPDKHSRATVPFDKDPFAIETSEVIIDQTYVSNNRVDVNSAQTVAFHGRWNNGSEIIGGSIYVNETEYITNKTGWIMFTTKQDTVGKQLWNVTKVSCNGITTYEQVVKNPYIVWDRVKIVDGGVSQNQTKLTQTETVWFQAVYEYDSETFDGSKGTLYLNGSSLTWPITNKRWEHAYSFDTSGTRTFKISGVSDSLFNLTVINDFAGTKSITWQTSPTPSLIAISLWELGLVCLIIAFATFILLLYHRHTRKVTLRKKGSRNRMQKRRSHAWMHDFKICEKTLGILSTTEKIELSSTINL